MNLLVEKDKTMRKTMTPILISLLGSMALAADPNEEVIKQEKAKLQGTWVVVKSESDGVEPEDPPKVIWTHTFKDGMVIIQYDDKDPREVPYEIDPTKSPKTIDYVFPKDNPKKEKSPGIYYLDGDTLTVSRTVWGFPRPKDFSPDARAVVLTMKKQPNQTQDELIKQSSTAIAEWVLGEVTPHSAEAIDWLTDLQQGYDLSDSKKLPLVIYLNCENENGPLPNCRRLEEGTFTTREFNLLGKSAVFVRINTAAENLPAGTKEFVQLMDVKEVPLLNFMEGSSVSHGSILGVKPTEEYIRDVRRKLIKINLAKLSRGKPKCTNAEFMRGFQTFAFETDAFRKKEDAANAMRDKVLDYLRDKGQFQIAEFLAADQALEDVQLEIRKKVLALAERDSPVIKEFCAANLEYNSIFRDAAYLLKRDLLGVTANGRFLEDNAINVAKQMLKQSQQELKAEQDAVTERMDSAANALEDRFNAILQLDEPPAKVSK